MHDVTYRTLVSWVPPSPLGLVGDRWAVEHRCGPCHQAVATDRLLSHAENHARGDVHPTSPGHGRAC